MNTGSKNEDRGLFPLDGDRGYSDTYHQDQFPLMPNTTTPTAPNTSAGANTPMLTGPIPSLDVQQQQSSQPTPAPIPTPIPSPPVVQSASKMSDWNYVFFFGGLMAMIISAILFFAVYNKAPVDALANTV